MKIQIQSQIDRNNFVIALANNGYKSYVEVKEDVVYGDKYYVVFEEQQS
jgi:hypothetical protein